METAAVLKQHQQHADLGTGTLLAAAADNVLLHEAAQALLLCQLYTAAHTAGPCSRVALQPY